LHDYRASTYRQTGTTWPTSWPCVLPDSEAGQETDDSCISLRGAPWEERHRRLPRAAQEGAGCFPAAAPPWAEIGGPGGRRRQRRGARSRSDRDMAQAVPNPLPIGERVWRKSHTADE